MKQVTLDLRLGMAQFRKPEILWTEERSASKADADQPECPVFQENNAAHALTAAIVHSVQIHHETGAL
jgi:hypothetical protein